MRHDLFTYYLDVGSKRPEGRSESETWSNSSQRENQNPRLGPIQSERRQAKGRANHWIRKACPSIGSRFLEVEVCMGGSPPAWYGMCKDRSHTHLFRWNRSTHCQKMHPHSTQKASVVQADLTVRHCQTVRRSILAARVDDIFTFENVYAMQHVACNMMLTNIC